jgi:hypothetical protein
MAEVSKTTRAVEVFSLTHTSTWGIRSETSLAAFPYLRACFKSAILQPANAGGGIKPGVER